MQGICVFDFDQSITAQTEFLKQFQAKVSTKPLAQFQSKLRFWCSPSCFAKVSNAMQMSQEGQFALLGSGDYHYLTLALLQQHQTPLTLVLFDNHPNWLRPLQQYRCNTWVYAAARLPQVERVVIVGLENGDLCGKKFQEGDVESYLSKKIILLPYSGVEIAINAQETLLLQSQLKHSLKAGVQEILDAISTNKVYLSIDKDCLRAEDAVTNWGQGTLPLETLTTCIKAIGRHHTIIGADTVGDYSPPVFSSLFKWIASFLVRPHNTWRLQASTQANAVNGMANVKIAHALGFN
jgi:hypothetical protein